MSHLFIEGFRKGIASPNAEDATFRMISAHLRVAHYDANQTLELREPLLRLYLASHADQQDNPWYSPEQFWDRLIELYAPGRDFGLVAGWINHAMVGYAFGSPRDNARDIWDMVRDSMPDISVGDTSEPVYVFREFAVDPSSQGKGYGRILHDTLLKSRSERLAHLLVRPNNSARNAYLRWGWHVVGQVQPFADAPLMDAMVHTLPLEVKT